MSPLLARGMCVMILLPGPLLYSVAKCIQMTSQGCGGDDSVHCHLILLSGLACRMRKSGFLEK